jgi:sulfate permease, SulP family
VLIMDRFRGYNFLKLQKDCIAGLIVGVVAIPLAMAFAIASGVKPEYGIYTSIIAGALISIFGGSKFQIGGPTGAFVPVLLAIVNRYGYEDLLIAGFLAGFLLVIMGLLKFGSFISYIPRSVTIGFTAGIAVIIFTGQISNFLGLRNLVKHDLFLPNMLEIAKHLNTINIYSILTACISLFMILISPRILPRVPGPVVGLLISSLIANLCYPTKVPTIATTFGNIPNRLPVFHFPDLTIHTVQSLLGSACIIAALGSIESLLSAVVADGMTGDRHDSNRELIGQGIANIVTPLFGGIPATGAVARTATGIRNGSTSPLTGVIHSIVVLLTLLIFAPFASKIPLSSMAPILMVVAWNMSEFKEFRHIVRTKSSDSIVLLITFLLTVCFDLTTGVGIGLLLAVLLFVKRVSTSHRVLQVLPDPLSKKVRADHVTETHTCPQISIYTIEGPLFFGAAHTFERTILERIHDRSRVLVLRMGKVPFLDLTGESYLASIVKHFQKHDGTVIVSGLSNESKETLRKTGLYDTIGSNCFFDHTGEALRYALELINHKNCIGCQHFVFEECKHLSKGYTYKQIGSEHVRMEA